VPLALTVLLLVVCLVFGAPQNAEAYIGPGAGISAIGTVIALVGVLLLAIVGFVWYPTKRLFSMIKNKNKVKYSPEKNTSNQKNRTGQGHA